MQYISEHEANPQLSALYERLKLAFETKQVPLFFLYLGVFPEYLTYITDQIELLLQDEKFKRMNHLLAEELSEMTTQVLDRPHDKGDWLERYRNTPGFSHLQQSLTHIHERNMSLALVFVGLREAVKGWAVAAKRLSTQTTSVETVNTEHTVDNFVMEGYLIEATSSAKSEDKQTNITQDSRAIVARDRDSLERHLFPEYLRMHQNAYHGVVRTEQYLLLRVQVEELLLRTLPLLPHPLVSPINLVLELSSQYPNLMDLLHILSEQFPTLAVQRSLFSAYLLDSKI